MRVSSQLHALAALTLEKYPGTHFIGGWMELVWTQWLVEKSFASAGDRTPVTHFRSQHVPRMFLVLQVANNVLS
jgi:hypothetical protein